jgi:hypothetical protein
MVKVEKEIEETYKVSWGSRMKNWHDNLHISDKRFLWVFIGSLIIVLVMYLTFVQLREWSSDIPIYECNEMIKEGILKYKANSFWEVFLAENLILVYILVAGIVIGFIFHGVGFRIIG